MGQGLIFYFERYIVWFIAKTLTNPSIFRCFAVYVCNYCRSSILWAISSVNPQSAKGYYSRQQSFFFPKFIFLSFFRENMARNFMWIVCYTGRQCTWISSLIFSEKKKKIIIIKILSAAVFKFIMLRINIDHILSLFSLENCLWHFMQVVSSGDNLHEMSNTIFCKNLEIDFKMLSAKILPSMLSVFWHPANDLWTNWSHAKVRQMVLAQGRLLILRT